MATFEGDNWCEEIFFFCEFWTAGDGYIFAVFKADQWNWLLQYTPGVFHQLDRENWKSSPARPAPTGQQRDGRSHGKGQLVFVYLFAVTDF